MGELARDDVALPAMIPLFPLPNAVLFPGVPLPLHVFEPRYREMVRDADGSDHRMIGMVLLRGEWRKEYYANPEVFPVGCAGKMGSVEPLADGRYNIVLHGVREFEIRAEDHERSYRRAEVVWRPAASGAMAPQLREQIERLVRQYLQGRSSNLPETLLADAAVPAELLVNFLCYALDFPPLEKQALLEVAGPTERGERLCDVLQFAMKAGGAAADADEWTH
jgi:uncharacterized protein